MIFCPLPGTPIVTQGFGQNPELYAQYGYDGHNGFDFGVAEGTMIYAPHDGVVSVKDDGTTGYGLYAVIEAPNRRSLLAHCSQVLAANGQSIAQGDPVAKSGKSGNCFGPHLHWTFKILKNGVVQNKTNGYDGAMDVSEFTRLWQPQDLHRDGQFTTDALGYLALSFGESQYLKRQVG
ncbi:MAG: M23 family metallopeptidase [Candidatus Peribacteraceae bacterium]|jgi:murein DD-endopeptidase MepM/ murein hydrolase activator NlpD